MATILLTGNAGFIGYHLFKRLQQQGHQVLGIDNLNNYYDVNLKLARLRDCGFVSDDIAEGRLVTSEAGGSFLQINLADRAATLKLFQEHRFDYVCHLAAQAGVRYSLENPHTYIDSNIVGFLNILEGCRQQQTKHLVYASSSSVYGNTDKIPFRVEDPVEHPISLYAATKKSNELMAYCYSHLFAIPVTGLRFFTVYGPWGRPDMALFKFTQAILAGKPIPVFNHGDLQRDFTYITDIVEGVWRVLFSQKTTAAKHFTSGEVPSQIYNIGNGHPVKLLDFIQAIEKSTGKQAIINSQPMKPGDVYQTWADTTTLERDFGFRPQMQIETGIQNFVDWYRTFYQQ